MAFFSKEIQSDNNMILHNGPIFFRLRGPSFPPESEAPQMLGRIVRNFAQPLDRGYKLEDASPFHLRPPNEIQWLNASSIFSSTKSGMVRLRMSSVGDGERSKSEENSFDLENSEIRALELYKQPEVYAKMM
jgi:hypothetical protein